MNRTQRRILEKLAKKDRNLIPEAMHKLRKKAENNRGVLIAKTLAGWDFLLSVDIGGIHGKHEHWHLSAQLTPVGRSSISDDWNNLGRAIKGIGVPDEVFESGMEQIEKYPGNVIHYPWTEPRD